MNGNKLNKREKRQIINNQLNIKVIVNKYHNKLKEIIQTFYLTTGILINQKRSSIIFILI